jgi:GPH family glycoside/pentoside/hexuronide:cation symporter
MAASEPAQAEPSSRPAAEGRALSAWQKLMYALGNFAQGVGPAIVVGWLQYYYTKTGGGPEVAGAGGAALLSYAAFGYIAGGARLMEAAANPIVGWLSDRTRTRWGRRKPFIVAASPVLALAFVLVWFPPLAGPGAANAVWLAALLGLFWLAYASVVGPYLSLLPEITPYLQERLNLSAVMGGFEVAGMLVSSVAAGLVIEGFRGGLRVGPVGVADGYRVVAIAVGVLTLACFLLSVRFVRETPHSAAKEVPFHFGSAAASTFRNRLFLPYVLSVAFFRIGIDSVIVAMPYLAVKVLGRAEDVAGYLQGAVIVASAAMFPVVSWLSGRRGKKLVYLVGLGGFAIGLPLLFFVGRAPFLGLGVVKLLGLGGVGFAHPFAAAQLAHIVCVLAVIAFPIATSFVLPRAIFADVVDEDERLTGYRREAMYNGMEGILSKAAAASVPVITSQLFARFGATGAQPLGILLVGPVAGVLVCFGVLGFLRYPLKA